MSKESRVGKFLAHIVFGVERVMSYYQKTNWIMMVLILVGTFENRFNRHVPAVWWWAGAFGIFFLSILLWFIDFKFVLPSYTKAISDRNPDWQMVVKDISEIRDILGKRNEN